MKGISGRAVSYQDPMSIPMNGERSFLAPKRITEMSQTIHVFSCTGSFYAKMI
jgi:hypothetical protein